MIPEERRYLPKPIRYYALPLICLGLAINVGVKYWITNNFVVTEPIQIVTTREKDKDNKRKPGGVYHDYPSTAEQYDYKRTMTPNPNPSQAAGLGFV